MDRSLLEALAHHEAGHAVVNRIGGVSVDAVDVTDRLTKTTVVGLEDLEGARPAGDEYRRRAEPFLVGQLAGGLAERKFTGEPTDSGSDDRVNAAWLAIEICPGHLGLQEYLDLVGDLAERAVDANWPAIRRVAGKLIEVGHIDGHELDQLIGPEPEGGQTT
jgi:hypothetical protein